MKATDLDLRELLHFEPKGGVMTFGGQRVILLDPVALGLLRKELIETLGTSVARGVLTRLGYAHGWRTAENLRTAFPWDDENEWQSAGGLLHMLQGTIVFEPPKPGAPPWSADSTWLSSYEAEQHLLHLGRADEPVCWTMTGFASGYLSCCNGREVYVVEDKCQGRGDAVCHIVGHTRERWGAAIEPHLPYYRKESIDSTLREVAEALRRTERRLRAKRREMERLEGGDDASGIVARSEGMKRVLDLARRVARSDSTVVVTGESGVGKERVARLLHQESSRAPRPFVALNCGAVSEALLESELFGHARGAFTGAERDREGLFEAADGGTLFLDEVAEISQAMQVKLLRVLQELEVRRLGENVPRPVDVRIVAATNRNLAEEVETGRFRRDLYYRLRVIELAIPPLRERRDDVLPLARHFLAELARREGRKITGFSPRAADQLLRHDWRGNVRELHNAVAHAVALCTESRVELEDLPEELRAALPRPEVVGRVRPLAEVEREYVLAALRANGGNKARAAAQLEMGLTTLFRKLKQYGAAGQGEPA